MTPITPISKVLPTPPFKLPPRMPRKSGVTPYKFLSDLDPSTAEGHEVQELFAYPYGPNFEPKWVTAKDIITDLVSKGYDREIASHPLVILDNYTFQKIEPYYLDQEQADRNRRKKLARLRAEQLVGTQTPPPSDETPTPQE